MKNCGDCHHFVLGQYGMGECKINKQSGVKVIYEGRSQIHCIAKILGLETEYEKVQGQIEFDFEGMNDEMR